MLHLDLIAAGKLKKGPLFDLQQDYLTRIRWPLNLHEIESRYNEPDNMNADENRKILGLINPSAFIIVMDERGDGLRSLDFADTIRKLRDNGTEHLQFLIGGADGLSEEVRDKASFMLSFGRQTWPHMMVRVMLLEQIYRAQQILAGHPYHRE